ncbi:MAG: VanZ family protein [Candidatus Limnocylindria bacterium]
MARIGVGLLLGTWMAGGLLLTLSPVYPAAGQVVEPNVVPLRTIGIYVANLDSGFWLRNLVGNLLLLLPLGLVGPIVFPWMDRWLRVFVAAVALSAAIELAQLWIPERSADVDDVLLNVAGALLGYAILSLLRKGSGRPIARADRD